MPVDTLRVILNRTGIKSVYLDDYDLHCVTRKSYLKVHLPISPEQRMSPNQLIVKSEVNYLPGMSYNDR